MNKLLLTTLTAGLLAPAFWAEGDDLWKGINAIDRTMVKPGTALDLSRNSALPLLSGQLQRLAVNTNGELACGGEEGSIRLMGFNHNLRFTERSDQPGMRSYRSSSPEEIQAFARGVRTRGYNSIRLFGIDQVCWYQDCEPKPEMVAQVDQFMAALGANGVYAYLPLVGYGNYLSLSSQQKNHHNERKVLMLLGDETIRRAWKFGAEFWLNRVNPSNGKTYKDDTTIGVLEFYNEIELGLLSGHLSPETVQRAQERFTEFLKRHYPESADGQPAMKEWLLTRDATPEMLHFFAELELECFDWCEKTVRDIGYKGLTAQFDITHWLENQAVRYRKSAVTLAHKYYQHPSTAGGKLKFYQGSCVGDYAQNFIIANATRFADRPHFITEYNAVQFNDHLYEVGPLFAAYAALQGTAALYIHNGAVIPTPKVSANPYDIFTVGSNPVLLGGEFLGNTLYLRRDVRAASHRVDMRIMPKDRQKFQMISGEQMKIALLTGFALDFPGLSRPAGLAPARSPDLCLAMAGSSTDSGETSEWSVDLKTESTGDFALGKLVQALRQKGVLPHENRSDTARGLLESETGELLLDSPNRTFQVRTPRTEIVVSEAGTTTADQAALKLVCSSIPATLGVVAVDGRPLRESARLVLVYTTKFRYLGEKHENFGNYSIVQSRGTLPGELRCGNFTVTLVNQLGRDFELYALGMDGERQEKLPMEKSGELLQIKVDTSTLAVATPFFELVATGLGEENKE